MSDEFVYVEVEINNGWKYDSANSTYHSYSILTSTDYVKNVWNSGSFASNGQGIRFAISAKDIKKLDFVKYEYYARIKHPEENIQGEGSKFCSEYDLIARSRNGDERAKVVYRRTKDGVATKSISDDKKKELDELSLL